MNIITVYQILRKDITHQRKFPLDQLYGQKVKAEAEIQRLKSNELLNRRWDFDYEIIEKVIKG